MAAWIAAVASIIGVAAGTAVLAGGFIGSDPIAHAVSTIIRQIEAPVGRMNFIFPLGFYSRTGWPYYILSAQQQAWAKIKRPQRRL